MKTIVFDFDGTLTKKNNNIWFNMWNNLDALDVDEKLYKQYYNKEIDYVEWCKEIEKEFIKRDFNRDDLTNATKEITLIDTLEETLSLLKEKGYHLYIVSGGVKDVITSKLGELTKYFDDIFACDFIFDDHDKLISIIPTKYDDEGKKWFIDEYCKKTNSHPSDIIFVGNDTNDEYVHLSGCKTICFNPSKNSKHEDSRIWHNVVRSEKIKDILECVEDDREHYWGHHRK